MPLFETLSFEEQRAANVCNVSVFLERPDDICIDNTMKLTRTNLITITIYSVIFAISTISNSLMIAALLHKNKIRHSHVHRFMLHLCIADLIVTFVTIPLEIGWKLTVDWRIGDLGCRIFQFLRPLGIYLSSFIIISLCIDRYFAILYPLKMRDVSRRTERLILLSWIFSILASAPQIFVFSTKVHPRHKWYTQCLDFSFETNHDNAIFVRVGFLAYQIFVAMITFFLPLLVILFTYSGILRKIIRLRQADHNDNDMGNNSNPESLFSKSREARMKRAKVKTLKLAILIVLVFLICWTPYYTISIMFWVDREYISKKIDDRIYNFFFIFAVCHCFANPMVYGLNAANLRFLNFNWLTNCTGKKRAERMANGCQTSFIKSDRINATTVKRISGADTEL